MALPTQFKPPEVVLPGNAGLPIGLAADGAVLPTHEPVVEYESPLQWHVRIYLSIYPSNT